MDEGAEILERQALPDDVPVHSATGEDLTGKVDLVKTADGNVGVVARGTKGIDFEALDLLGAKNHVKFRDFSVPRRRGIGGAHDATEFAKYSSEYSILDKTPTSVPGVEKIEYKIYALDAKGNPTGTLKSTIYEKTVYDPSIWTDARLEKSLKEALSKSISRNRGTLPVDSPTYGMTSEGYKIIFTHQDGKITSFWFD